MLRCNLNGLRFCARSANPILRRDKREFFERRVRGYMPMLKACIELAPTDAVQRALGELQRELEETFGPPTPAQVGFSDHILRAAVGEFQVRGDGDPPLQRDEFRRYVYRDRAHRPGYQKPYTVSYPRRAPAREEADAAGVRLAALS
jgi:hypothetical protein